MSLRCSSSGRWTSPPHILDRSRTIEAEPDPEGRKRLRASAPTYLAASERHFLSRLTGEEAQVLAKALGRVVTAEEGNPPETEAPSA